MSGMMETIAFNRDALREAASKGYSTATDLADWLVRELAMPFREAHHVTGAVVKRAETLGAATLADLPLAEFQKIEPRITEAARALLTVEQSAASRDSYGGTAPVRVREQAALWAERLADDE
ncbi:MAG: argininosuccinate lyase [Alphaproteobacteria bacterium]|nr:MAG: argininosuccinate lyase [Alphaproteobacteria bacterium]